MGRRRVLQAAISTVGALGVRGAGGARGSWRTSRSPCSSASSPLRLGRFGTVTALAYPVVLAGFVALFARSTFLTLRGGTVPWRGRQVAVRT